MAWFKVDDQLHSHPKARRAGLEAMGLWLLAGSHCMSYLTDGFVEAWFVQSWPHGPELANVLVREGLWLKVEGGWQFHDWGEFQPTREKVEAERESAAERQRRKRDRDSDGRYMSRRDTGVTHGAVTSTPSPSPSPSPKTNTYVNRVSPVVDVRELSTDAETSKALQRRADELKIDVWKIHDLVETRCQRVLEPVDVINLAEAILAKSKRLVRHPMGYITSAFNEPFEIQAMIDRGIEWEPPRLEAV